MGGIPFGRVREALFSICGRKKSRPTPHKEIVMKIMISQPMAGLSAGEIRHNRSHVVSYLEKRGHEVIDSIISDRPDNLNNEPLYCLGRSFELLSKMDACFFMKGWHETRGCWMEHEACIRYGVPVWYEGEEEPCNIRKS